MTTDNKNDNHICVTCEDFEDSIKCHNCRTYSKINYRICVECDQYLCEGCKDECGDKWTEYECGDCCEDCDCSSDDEESEIT